MISAGVPMRFPIRAIPILAVAILLSAGCNKKAAEPVPVAALERPVLALDAKAGRVLIPSSQLVERGGVPGVFVLTGENRARFRMVRTGKTVNDRVEILSGLSGSETLVAGDLRDVHDGSLIRPPRMAEVPETQEQFVPGGTASRSGRKK
jgi:hypothetical protein